MMEILYKYRADSEYTEEILTSGEVFLATAHQLNDPFECTLQDISSEWMAEKITTNMQSSLSGFIISALRSLDSGSEFFGLKAEEIEGVLEEIKTAGTLEQSYDEYRAFVLSQTGHPPSDTRVFFRKLDEQLTQTGIFSLSANPANPLMWAHYGGEHYGLCFGFSREQNTKLSADEHCLPITYSDELPEMEGDGLQTTMTMSIDSRGLPYTSSVKLSFTDKTFQRVVTTKPTAWSYEEEYRYIEPFGGSYDFPGPLVECTFGLRCPESRRNHYINLIEANVPNDVLLFEMRRKHGTNRMERVPFDPTYIRGKGTRYTSSQSPIEPSSFSPKKFGELMEQLMQQERYEEVIFQTGENLKKAPGSGLLIEIKAAAHGYLFDHQEAYELYNQLTKLFPNVASGWYGMACACTAMGRLDEVVPLLRQAQNIDPQDPSIALNLGVHLTHKPNTHSEGIKYLKKAERLGHRRARRIINELNKNEF